MGGRALGYQRRRRRRYRLLHFRPGLAELPQMGRGGRARHAGWGPSTGESTLLAPVVAEVQRAQLALCSLQAKMRRMQQACNIHRAGCNEQPTPERNTPQHGRRHDAALRAQSRAALNTRRERAPLQAKTASKRRYSRGSLHGERLWPHGRLSDATRVATLAEGQVAVAWLQYTIACPRSRAD